MNNFQDQLDNIINRGRNVDRGMADDVRAMVMQAYNDFQLVVNSVGLRAQVDIAEDQNNIFEDVIELMVEQQNNEVDGQGSDDDSDDDSDSDSDSDSASDSDSDDDGEVNDDPMSIDELENSNDNP